MRISSLLIAFSLVASQSNAKDLTLGSLEFKISSPDMPFTRASLHVLCNRAEEESWIKFSIKSTGPGEYTLSHDATEDLAVAKSSRCRLTLALMNDNYVAPGISNSKGVFVKTVSSLRFEPFTVKELRKTSIAKLITDRFEGAQVIADFKNGEVPILGGRDLPKKFLVPELWIQRRGSEKISLCDQAIPGIYEWTSDQKPDERYVLVLGEDRDMKGEAVAALKVFDQKNNFQKETYVSVKSCNERKKQLVLKSSADLENPSTESKNPRSAQAAFDLSQKNLRIGRSLWKRSKEL